MKRYTIDGFERITKATARRMYDSGEAVYLCACNLRPGYPYYPEAQIRKEYSFEYFDNKLNTFEYYNCINSETGRKAAFYRRAEK